MRYLKHAAIALTATTLACSDQPAPTAVARTTDGPRLITNGTPTGGSYGNVGALLVDYGGDGTLDSICSGSVIAPTVFLTAGHCTDAPAGSRYYVSFAPDVLPLSLAAPLILATGAYTAPSDDIGVVTLPAGATAGIQPLALPAAGLLDAVKKGGNLARETAVVVGYGVASLNKGPRTTGLDGVRKVADTKVLWLKDRVIGLADAHGQSGSGGTCGGDSGGPVFLAGQGSNVIVAVTSYGFPAGCHAIGGYARLDTQSARAFLDDFVTLP